MTKFLKLFLIGIKDGIEWIGAILIILMPFIVAFILACITGLILKQFISVGPAIIFAVLAGILGFWLSFVVSHCIEAMKYIKETNTDSLSEAWGKTDSIYW